MFSGRDNRTNNKNNAPSPQNNSSCYTRGPVELQAYESCYTTVFQKQGQLFSGDMTWF